MRERERARNIPRYLTSYADQRGDCTGW